MTVTQRKKKGEKDEGAPSSSQATQPSGKKAGPAQEPEASFFQLFLTTLWISIALAIVSSAGVVVTYKLGGKIPYVHDWAVARARASSSAPGKDLLGLGTLGKAPIFEIAGPEDYLSRATQFGSLDALSRASNASWHTCMTAPAEERDTADDLLRLGMAYLAAFNLPEAQRAFQYCSQADPACSVCYLGSALAQGPHVNLARIKGTVEPDFPAFTDVQRKTAGVYALIAHDLAISLLKNAEAAKEENPAILEILELQARLATAVVLRYTTLAERESQELPLAPPEIKDAAGKKSMEEQYADFLSDIVAQKPHESHVAALAAHARMQLVAWDYLDPKKVAAFYEGNKDKEEKDRVKIRTFVEMKELMRPHAVRAMDDVRLALADKKNLLALHLDIHLRESFPPDLLDPAIARDAFGLPSADALFEIALTRGLPLGMGHLAHMPSHAFILDGQWKDAVRANYLAHVNDRASALIGWSPYLPEHNVHTLIYAAGMFGDRDTAQTWAKEIRQFPSLFNASHLAPGQEWTTLILTWLRFGDYRSIMKVPPPTPGLHRGFSHVGGYEWAAFVFRFARTMALSNMEVNKSPQELRKALAALEAAYKAVKEDKVTKPGPPPGIYSGGYKQMADVYLRVAQAKALLYTHHAAVRDASGAAKEAAEKAEKEAKVEALKLLKEAVALEDKLPYLEPPRSFIPLRPCYGQALMETAAKGNKGAKFRDRARELFTEDMERNKLNAWGAKGIQQLEGTFATAEALHGQGFDALPCCPMMAIYGELKVETNQAVKPEAFREAYGMG